MIDQLCKQTNKNNQENQKKMSYASLIIYFRHSFSPQALLKVPYKKTVLSRYKHTSQVKVNIAEVDLSKIPLNRIRNFSIIAHIGKLINKI